MNDASASDASSTAARSPSATGRARAGVRFLACLASWAILFLASPGILSRDGAGPLALVALVPWALACRRAGKRAFLLEWLAGGIGSAALCVWSAYVWPGTLLFIALVPGFYFACSGSLLRLLARRFPLALAAPVAWVALETLRVLVDPPLAFGWLRLGTCLHATELVSGSARVWGTGGLSFAAAACAGGVADLVRRRPPAVSLALGVGPLALAAVLAAATSPPQLRDGPRVLLVQPAFEQRFKMKPPRWEELLQHSLDLTVHALADLERDRAPLPDLVCWGETMFPFPMGEEGLAAAYDAGARSPKWTRDDVSRRWIDDMAEVERSWVQHSMLGADGVLPEGTSFLSGVELYSIDEGAIRRSNAVLLWGPGGARAGVGGKIHLVPGAESLAGFERIGWIRGAVEKVAGYVPDLVALAETRVLALRTRDGRSFRFGTSVCFDNSYDDPYTAPLREGTLDFHLVCSNEAWYEKSFEYDQMIAFSRLLAIATGRSFVRATNAGISVVIAPDGREVARLAVGGEDRMVAGTLCAAVPVPVEGAAGARTPFVRLEKGWLGLWLGLPFLLAFFVVRAGYTSIERE